MVKRVHTWLRPPSEDEPTLHCCLGFVALCKLLKENFGVKCALKRNSLTLLHHAFLVLVYVLQVTIELSLVQIC